MVFIALLSSLNLILAMGCAVGMETGTFGSDTPPPAQAVRIREVAAEIADMLIFITNLTYLVLMFYKIMISITNIIEILCNNYAVLAISLRVLKGNIRK